MNPDGTADLNLISFCGPEDNYKVFITKEPIGCKLACYTAALKFTSKVNGIYGRFTDVIGGIESTVDCNNQSSYINLSADLWDISQTKYGFTNKGSCNHNSFTGLVRGHGKEVDFDQDNWSDQCHEPCKGTVLALISEDKKPIRVRYIYNKPDFKPGTGPYRFVFPWPWLPVPRSWIGMIFNQLRRLGFFK